MSDLELNVVHTGDAFDVLAELPESSVHMVMTSPPYFGLRDYGHDEQIGLEESLDEYVDKLVRVGDELRRVLRDDGSWWLNLGDSYAGSGGAGGQWNGDESGDVEYAGERGESYNGPLNGSGFGRKNKMLVPHRVAIALQNAGWVVRNDVTWVKPNPMPSSVKDRLNTTTEQVFHLTPEPHYYYDLDSIREPHAESTQDRAQNSGGSGGWVDDVGGQKQNVGLQSQDYADQLHPAGKNPGDVFEVTTKPFPEAHFAVYPPELCEKPIKATCPPRVCADCGAPYEREVERTPGEYDYSDRSEEMDGSRARTQSSGTQLEPAQAEHKGWTPTCNCDTDETRRGVVLDPFAGAGTTLLKAKELGREYVGIELNPEYADIARKRVGLDVNDPSRFRDDDAAGLDEFA